MLFRRRDLPRIAMPIRRGKTDLFEPFGWPLNLVYGRFKRGKSATTWRPFEQPSVLHCHAVKAWQRVLFRRRGLPRSAMPFRRGKTHVFEPFGWALNRFKGGGPSSSLPSFTAMMFKAGQRVLFRRRDLPRSAMLLRRGKTDVFGRFGCPLNLFYWRFKASKWATTWRPFEQPSF